MEGCCFQAFFIFLLSPPPFFPSGFFFLLCLLVLPSRKKWNITMIVSGAALYISSLVLCRKRLDVIPLLSCGYIYMIEVTCGLRKQVRMPVYTPRFFALFHWPSAPIAIQTFPATASHLLDFLSVGGLFSRLPETLPEVGI